MQATWIRNTILRALRESVKVDTRKVNSTFVYEYPTISSLASFVLGLALGTTESTLSKPATQIEAMRSMVAKYSNDFPVHQGRVAGKAGGGDVVLLTGTTGGFGCYILTEFVHKRKVSRVYCFNRAPRDGATLRERQRLALLDRGLDANVLDSEKVVLLEGDLAAADFGLSKEVYQEVSRLYRCLKQTVVVFNV